MSRLARVAAPLLIAAWGCADAEAPDDASTSAGGPDEGDDAGEVDGTCPQASDGLGHVGEPCDHNGDCVSELCVAFQDVPKDPEARCAQAPPGDRMRFSGRVLDFETREPLAGAHVSFVAGAAFPDAVFYDDGFVSTFSDPRGDYDVTSSGGVEAPVAIVAGVQVEGHLMTGTEIATPDFDLDPYGGGPNTHDAWAVRPELVTEWSMQLAQEAMLAPFLPLEEKGGIVGFMRRQGDGMLVPGLTVVHSGPSIPLYLTADGTFSANPTLGTGYFVLLNSEPGELVGVIAPDGTPSCQAHTAITGSSSISAMVFQVSD